MNAEIEALQRRLADAYREIGVLNHAASEQAAYNSRVITDGRQRIAELEAENENHLQWGISNATGAAKLRVRIEDLEGWLVEERSLAIQQNPNRTREYGDAESIDIARQQLRQEGKLSPDDKSAKPAEMSSGQPREVVCEHCCEKCREKFVSSEHFSATTEMVLTKEQREALDAIRDLVTSETRSDYVDNAVDVLDTLLSAPPAWEVTRERERAIRRAIRGMIDPKYHHSDFEKRCVAVLRAMLEEARP